MTREVLARAFVVLLVTVSCACINVTSEAVTKDEQARAYVRKQRASKEEPHLAVSGSGTRLVVAARWQPVCVEETVAASERVEVTTTKPAAEKDQNWLTGCWIAGVLGVGTGVVSFAIAPALSNTSHVDDQGNKTGSDRQGAWMVGLVGLLVGVPTLLAAIIDQSRLGTHEQRGAPRESITATQDVPCGDGRPVANAQVSVSGSVESAVVGQTDAQGHLEIDLRSLPNRVREEIRGLGQLEVTTDGRVPARAVWLLPEETAARLRGNEPAHGQQVAQERLALSSGNAAPTVPSALASPAGAGIRMQKCEVDDKPRAQNSFVMGNGNGQIDRGELVAVTCHLQNTALNMVGDLRLEPVSTNSDVMLVQVQPLKLASWPSQAAYSVNFGLTVKKAYDLLESVPLPVGIRVTRDRSRVVTDVPLGLYLGAHGR